MSKVHQRNAGYIGVDASVYSELNVGKSISGMTGGSIWFSPGYFGVDPISDYLIPIGSYSGIRYRRTQTSSYSWWALFCTKSGNSYTVVYGARVITPAGTAGEVIELQFSQAEEQVGQPIVSSGDTYLCWLSHAPGQTPSGPSSIHYFDTQAASYVQSSTVPNVGVTYTVTTLDTNGRPHYGAFGGVRLPGIFQLSSTASLLQRGLVYTSAWAYLEANPSATNGIYQLLINGNMRSVYCDMTTDGGGWMRVVNMTAINSTPTLAGTTGSAGDPSTGQGKWSDADINWAITNAPRPSWQTLPVLKLDSNGPVDYFDGSEKAFSSSAGGAIVRGWNTYVEVTSSPGVALYTGSTSNLTSTYNHGMLASYNTWGNQLIGPMSPTRDAFYNGSGDTFGSIWIR